MFRYGIAAFCVDPSVVNPPVVHVVMVLRAEDAVLEFLSVLSGLRGEDVHVALAEPRRHLLLPAAATTEERVRALGAYVAPVHQDSGRDLPPPGQLRALLATAAAASGTSTAGTILWTHSPADNRRARGRLGHEAARIARSAHHADVRHATGYQPYLQMLSDTASVLSPGDVAAKIDFVNQHCAHLLTCDDPQFAVDTGRVPATEGFFRSDDRERARLFALTANADEEAAGVADPWEFKTSAYERERLDATAAWIARRHTREGGGRVVEVGACEGALTTRLADRGFTVDATEPNAAFRSRLEALRGERVEVHPHDLWELCSAPLLPASAYLMIETLYYGQEPALFDKLPTDHLFLSLEPDTLRTRLRPWLEATPVWTTVEQVELAPPRVEIVCDGRAYLRKRGSRGVFLRRRPSPAVSGHHHPWMPS